MECISREVKIYISADGAEFLDEKECAAHEQSVKGKEKLLEGLQYWLVIHAADTTEGRGWYRHTHIALEPYGVSDDEVSPELLAFCQIAFGYPITFVQGVARMAEWKLMRSTRERYGAWKQDGVSWGGHWIPADAYLIANEAIGGFPPNLPLSWRRDSEVKTYVENNRVAW